MAQQKKQLHYLCISVGLLSLMGTEGSDEKKGKQEMLKVASKRWKEMEVCVVMY